MPGFVDVLKRMTSPVSTESRNLPAASSLGRIFAGASLGIGGISKAKALTIPAYYNAVNQLANDIAKLPKAVYQKTEEGRQKVAHPASFIISREPNPIMDSFTFHWVMMLSAIHRGNGLAYQERNQLGDLVAIHFIHPDKIRDIVLYQGEVFYLTDLGVFTGPEVIHIMGHTDNGYQGRSIIDYAGEVLNISKSAQEFTNDNYKNRGLGFGIVETDKAITQAEAKKKIEEAINSKLSSGSEKIKTAVIDEGMRYKPITLNMQDAQLIEQGKFSVLDICRFLNISPIKVKDYSHNSYSSAYQDAIDHVNNSIQPWAEKWHNEYNRKIFSRQEKDSLYVKFSDNVLLRGDLQAKAEYYSKMVFSGVYTRNEVREFEEMNRLDGLDQALTPVNTKLPEEIEKTLQDE